MRTATHVDYICKQDISHTIYMALLLYSKMTMTRKKFSMLIKFSMVILDFKLFEIYKLFE